MRTIAISDLHGMLDLFKKTLQDNNYNPKEDKLILLGDYVDRGKKSFETIEYVIELQSKGNVIALMGNHDDMFLSHILYPHSHNAMNWKLNGYRATIDSYERNHKPINFHEDWLKSLPLYHDDGLFFFCHAGIDPYLDLDKQLKETLIWAREEFYFNPTMMPKPVIFGHTIQEKCVGVYNNSAVGIDAGAFHYNRMTALIIEDEKIMVNVSKENSFENLINSTYKIV